MKGIKIRKTVYNDLTSFGDGMPITKVVKLLVDNAEQTNCMDDGNYESININLHDDTFDKMKRCKLTPNETHSDTIARLLKEYKESHHDVADD